MPRDEVLVFVIAVALTMELLPLLIALRALRLLRVFVPLLRRKKTTFTTKNKIQIIFKYNILFLK